MYICGNFMSINIEVRMRWVKIDDMFNRDGYFIKYSILLRFS